MPELDHERCSELLGGFLEGSLEAEATRAVERHLAGCAPCRAERAALEALRGGDAAPMTADERAALHAAVGRATSEAEVVPLARSRASSASRGWARRLAPALGAAALAALIAVGVATLGDGITGSDSEAGGASGAGGEGERVQAPLEAEEGTNADLAVAGASPQWIGSLGAVTAAELKRRGQTGTGLREQAVADPRPLAGSRLGAVTEELANRAPPELENQIRSCVKEVSKLGYTALPTFGAHAELEGRDVLVLGFVWTPKKGPLDRFMVWAFVEPSCDTVSYQAGPLKPAPE